MDLSVLGHTVSFPTQCWSSALTEYQARRDVLNVSVDNKRILEEA